MHKQQVRRRRAILALLVGLSLILLTAYFGESAGGGLHSVQRGVLNIFAPIQEGANRALKPVRDLAGWFGDTIDAKGERDKLKSERDRLRKQVLGAQAARRENAQLRGMVGLNRRPELESFAPLTARVIGRSPTVWYATLTIDKGTSSGIREDQAVISGAGLVGRVSQVTRGAAQVTLITDHTSGVSAAINDTGTNGLVKTAVGNPDDLLLDFVTRRTKIAKGQNVVTAGSRSSKLESLFPPGIPIGFVTRIESEELDLYQRVHIKAFADFRRLDFVQILIPSKGNADSGQDGAQDTASAP